MKILKLLIIIFAFQSCTTVRNLLGLSTKRNQLTNYNEYVSEDYAEHLSVLASFYKNNPEVLTITLSKRSKNYLKSLYQKITANNELIFDRKIDLKISVIESDTPFYFSLPGGKIFFSNGIIKKYFRHENWFVSAFTYEMIRSHRQIYEKSRIVPVGYISTEKILAITRIKLDHKIQVNKWSYFAMERAGFDPSSFLTWLQIQNKNALDFTLQIGGSRNITREEYLFKNFIVNQGVKEEDNLASEQNSSRDFYYFVNEIKRHKGKH